MQNLIHYINGSPTAVFSIILTLCVILVNGWTDAPNAIATCVATRSMSIRKAIIFAAVMNFFGTLIMTVLSPYVAETIYNIADFGTDTAKASAALLAAMAAIVIWAVAAWAFGIPTSESHALVAGVTGAAIALKGDITGINAGEWQKVITGLIISVALGIILGAIFSKALALSFSKKDRRYSRSFFKKAQIAAAGAAAFMHGAQDGQKFLGVMLLSIAFCGGKTTANEFTVPISLITVCASVMALGTSIGGEKIIKSVGRDMVRLEPHQGFAADAAASLSMLAAVMFGIPVSTTHTKTAAVAGAGMARRLKSVDWGIFKNMARTWLLTFPGCGLIGYFMSLFFINIL